MKSLVFTFISSVFLISGCDSDYSKIIDGNTKADNSIGLVCTGREEVFNPTEKRFELLYSRSEKFGWFDLVESGSNKSTTKFYLLDIKKTTDDYYDFSVVSEFALMQQRLAGSKYDLTDSSSPFDVWTMEINRKTLTTVFISYSTSMGSRSLTYKCDQMDPLVMSNKVDEFIKNRQKSKSEAKI
jgi:hypothetical protein